MKGIGHCFFCESDRIPTGPLQRIGNRSAAGLHPLDGVAALRQVPGRRPPGKRAEEIASAYKRRRQCQTKKDRNLIHNLQS